MQPSPDSPTSVCSRFGFPRTATTPPCHCLVFVSPVCVSSRGASSQHRRHEFAKAMQAHTQTAIRPQRQPSGLFVWLCECATPHCTYSLVLRGEARSPAVQGVGAHSPFGMKNGACKLKRPIQAMRQNVYVCHVSIGASMRQGLSDTCNHIKQKAAR